MEAKRGAHKQTKHLTNGKIIQLKMLTMSFAKASSRFTGELTTPADQSETTTITVNQNMTNHTKNYLTYWNTKSQTQSQCCPTLKRQYTVAAYLSTVTDVKHRKREREERGEKERRERDRDERETERRETE